MVEISQLLWAAQGRTSRLGGRTAPSAGALYPLELYLLLPDALHRYVPSRRRIELVAEADLGLGLGRPRRWGEWRRGDYSPASRSLRSPPRAR
jgi:hypothetical protein